MDEQNTAREGEDGTAAAAPKTFTQEQVNALIAREVGKLKSKFGDYDALREQAARLSDVEAERQRLVEERELAGKTAEERLRVQHQRELDRLQKALADRDKAIAEREQMATQAQQTLRAERVGNALTAALGKHRVIPTYLESARKLAQLDIAVEHGEDGSVTATYGDTVGSIEQAVAAWVKDHDNYLPAPSGGAGTRTPNGVPTGKPLHELSTDELVRLSARQKRR